MPKRALVEHRPWLLAGSRWLSPSGCSATRRSAGIFIIALKGALGRGIGGLCPGAQPRTVGPNYRRGHGNRRGGRHRHGAVRNRRWRLFFLVGHLVAIWLYRRNARPDPTGSQLGAAAALALGVPLIGWLLTGDLAGSVYALTLGAMAGSAWLSRFSRYHVGIGAVLFVASDLLIFARLGGVLDQSVTEWFVWPLYYAGQFLICTGVIRTVRRDHAA